MLKGGNIIMEITGYIGQDYKNRVNNQYAFNFIEMIKE